MSKYSHGPNCATLEASEYEFACHVADCPEASHESEDFQKCECCAVLLCSEHAKHMLNDPTPYCEECAACVHPLVRPAHCDGTAAFKCDECGALTCWNCVYREDHANGERSYFCSACAADILEPQTPAEVAYAF